MDDPAAALPAVSSPVIEVLAVAYRRFGELRVFVQSWLNQSAPGWLLNVLHDGPDAEFESIMRAFAEQAAGRIRFASTPARYNDYGHSLRELALREVRGDYVLITNADNYYVPRTVELLSEAITRLEPDVVLFDMVHSHPLPGGRPLPAYSYFQTAYARRSVDIGAAVVRAQLARTAGFRDKSHDGDASYFEDVARARAPEQLRICKLSRVLLVHN